MELNFVCDDVLHVYAWVTYKASEFLAACEDDFQVYCEFAGYGFDITCFLNKDQKDYIKEKIKDAIDERGLVALFEAP